MVERRLLCGCRYIELDVHDGTEDEPVVQKENSIATPLPLAEVVIRIGPSTPRRPLRWATMLRIRPAASGTMAASCAHTATRPMNPCGCPGLGAHQWITANAWQVLAAIARSAFTASPYPLLVGLAVECAPSQQRATARLLNAALGGMLHQPRQANGEAGSGDEGDGGALPAGTMPSPEALRGRVVLIHLLRRKQGGTAGGVGNSDRDSGRVEGQQGIDESGSGSDGIGSLPKSIVPELGALFSSTCGPISAATIGHGGQRGDPARARTGSPSLLSTAAGGRWQIASLGAAASGAVLDHEQSRELLLRNTVGLTHVAPRVSSGGMGNPFAPTYWAAGCQLVALSHGEADAVQQVSQGQFLLNGGCGYVLKPRQMRSSSEMDRSLPSALPTKLHKLTVKILCAQHLPKVGQRRNEEEPWQTASCPLRTPHALSAGPVVSPFVVIEAVGGQFAAAGDDLDECVHADRWMSRTVPQNGLSPQWMQTVEIGASDPELCVVRCSVWDKQPAGEPPKFLCYVTMPLCALRSGYRNVTMRDVHGAKIAFCKMLWQDRKSVV